MVTENVLHFALKTIGLSTINGRKPCTLMNAARHNLREIQAELGAAGHIDPRRMADNTILVGPATAAEVKTLADGLLAQVDTSKLKRDHVQALEVVFSLSPGTTVEVLAYFTRCLEWLRVAVPVPVLLATLHRDEATPHMHALLLPVKDGKHVGGALNTKPNLKRLRESFFSQVAGPAGLKREGAKVRGMVKQWAIAAVLARCKAMGLPAAMGPLWENYLATIERDPTPQVQALGIDVNALRPDRSLLPNSIGLQSTYIGLEPRAIGLQIQMRQTQALSCVGLPCPPALATEPQTASGTAAEPAIDALTDLWAAIGCHHILKLAQTTSTAL